MKLSPQDRLLDALRELADAAERDLKINRDDEDGDGGFWSQATEQAIFRARKLISLHTTPWTPSELPPIDDSVPF